ncbi:MAG: response regulator [Myxococcales bacterium]|nr:response regulator [Myxococcales bacterium]
MQSARILIIDDDDLFARSLARTLRREGYEVETARDGDEGLRSMAAHPADLVISDVVMPNKEGVETAVELRRNFPQVPLIAMSGAMAGSVYLEVLGKLGARATLQKPFEPEELIAHIRAALAG